MARSVRRVLITGSRDWDARNKVWDALEAELLIAAREQRQLVVVHGACKTGADLHAKQWCDWAQVGSRTPTFGVKAEPHPPKPVPRGTLIRNREMAESGVDAAHAFPNEGSTGTRHCMSRCYAAGVEPINHGYQPYSAESREFAKAYG